MKNMQPGDKVLRIRDYVPGGRAYLGHSVVESVKAHRVTLADGSVWRLRDGFALGATRTRGIGMEGERIVPDCAEERALVRFGRAKMAAVT